MDYPLTMQQLLEQIAYETARMSYPGGMSRGAKQIVTAGAKKEIEGYFVKRFPLNQLWNRATIIAKHYDLWHAEQTREIGDYLKQQKCLGYQGNNQYAVGAKVLNTFMHQLMKYEPLRPLWQQLHLPLDARVFQSFARNKTLAITKINSRIGTKTAYSILPEDYQFIQSTLWEFIDELNKRPGAEFQVRSRIELNYLWL
jgi:hypothetical protein